MSKKYKGPKIEYIKNPLTPFQKVHRWNECQEIARLFYQSNFSDWEIKKLYNYIQETFKLKKIDYER